MDRSKKIIRTSFVGIAVNVVLVIFKMTVGLIAGSIAVILDAVNNLSDALSSVITIIGTKLAGKAPDKKHPYGHGRIEYLTSVLIAVIILIAGLTSIKESVEKILDPTAASYSVISLIIISVAVVAKILCGTYVKKVGKEINSGSLIASGSDAFFDAVLSFATLVAAVISMVWGIGLEGWLGAVISIFIIKAGIEMLIETLNTIIGVRADKELTESLKEQICSYEGVYGAYDLTLHNYGPTKIIGSVHIEVPDDMTARDIHKLTRRISVEVFAKYGIILSVGIYALNNSSDELANMRACVEETVKSHSEVLQMHGFYVDEENGSVMFDIIVDFEADAAKIRDEIISELSEKYPNYRFDIILDSDFSE